VLRVHLSFHTGASERNCYLGPLASNQRAKLNSDVYGMCPNEGSDHETRKNSTLALGGE
jgi:hypothetical protein